MQRAFQKLDTLALNGKSGTCKDMLFVRMPVTLQEEIAEILAQTAYSPLPQPGCLVLVIKPEVKPEDV